MSYETQKEEIKTIKPRTFEIKLSDADVKRLYKKAFSVGLTPEELLADYIGDLVDGTYTRGSDERRMAQEYFDRCCYEFIPKNFIQWALYEYREGELETAINDFDDAMMDINYVEEEKETLTPEEYEKALAECLNWKQYVEKDLNDLYQEYLDYKKAKDEKTQELGAELKQARAFFIERESMIRYCHK